MNQSLNTSKVALADKYLLQSLMSQIKSKYQHKQENFQFDLQYSVQMNTERTKMTEDFQKAIMQRNRYLARNAITML